MGAAVFRALAVSLALVAATACTSIAANARTFAGTSWHVTAINGHATPASGEFGMAFEADRFSAQMGCNRAGGGYRIAGNTLRPGMVAMTQMACEAVGDVPIPLMTYEGWGMAVLSQPMRMTWHSDVRLTLSNAAGSIELERAR